MAKQTDWRVAYLRALGAKPTKAALDFLAKWQPFEGGHTNNDARFNFLNTTTRMPGSHAINNVGVQSYRTLAQGAQAFARTLTNPRYAAQYSGLVSFLRTGQGDPNAALQTWVSGKPDGNPEYAAKILGGSVPSSGVATSNVPAVTGPQTTEGVPPVPTISEIQSTAAQGFADIAQGRARPTDTFGPLLETIKAASAAKAVIPDVQIPTTTQGGSDLESQAAKLVRKYLGVQYVFGGETPTGFDCSGLVQYVYKNLGVKVPRTTYEQWGAGKPVELADLRPGDAVFFTGSDPKNGAPGHEGMYIGDGKMVVAPHTGAVVRIENISDRSDYVGARRFT